MVKISVEQTNYIAFCIDWILQKAKSSKAFVWYYYSAQMARAGKFLFLAVSEFLGA